jgi:FHS family L-fucose permease-like MFS transporter
MPSIVMALITMIVGCALILLAANLAVFPLVLVGLFVLASGITILQVAANPLVAALGNPDYSHFRLTFSQTFNSLGTFIAPILGAHLFLKGVEVKEGTVITPEVRAHALAGIDTAYFWLCGLIALLTIFMFLSRRNVTAALPQDARNGPQQGFVSLIADAFSSRWALFGGLAIFLYVGAEVAIGTQMTAFLNDNAIWGLSDAPFGVPLLGATMGSDGIHGVSVEEAGKAVAFYWGGAMVGRAIGSALLARVNASALLATFTAIACAMCVYVAAVGGVSAGFVALCIGLFNSIMFPVIFTITLERSSASAEATSGLLCTAIVGGAIVPLLVGKFSEISSYHAALIIPAVCYAVLCLFAIASRRARTHLRDEPAAATIH